MLRQVFRALIGYKNVMDGDRHKRIVPDPICAATIPEADVRADTKSVIRSTKEDVTRAEGDLLRLIRAKENQRLTVHVREGIVTQADVEEELNCGAQSDISERLADAIAGQDFATLTVSKRRGEVVNLKRRTPIKLDRDTGRTQPLSTGDVE